MYQLIKVACNLFDEKSDDIIFNVRILFNFILTSMQKNSKLKSISI